MNLIFIAAYGLFILLVGANGNARQLVDEAKQDIPGFLPWAISIGVIAIIWEFKETRKLAAPLLGLAVLNFVLKNWSTLQSQFKSLQKGA